MPTNQEKSVKPMTVGDYCRRNRILNVQAWNEYARDCIFAGVRYLDLDSFLKLELDESSKDN